MRSSALPAWLSTFSLCASVLAACSDPPSPSSTPVATTEPTTLPAPAVNPDSQVAPAAEGSLPVGWPGTGVLANLPVDLPSNAPGWTRVAAEVVERDGQRILITTAVVQPMQNTALARAAAGNRARAALARWVKQERLTGSTVTDTYASPDGRQFARAELLLSEELLPGTPTAAP